MSLASEQGLFAMVRPGESEMCIGHFGRFPAAWRSFEEPFFDQERFVNLFDSPGIFADCRSDGVQSDGAAAEFFNDRREYFVIHLIESSGVDIQGCQGEPRDVEVDMTFAFDHGEVTHTAQQGIGDARRSA